MKITAEMIRKVSLSLFGHYPNTNDSRVALALEAALADVPEPRTPDVRSRKAAAKNLARAEAAEAKLAEVRAVYKSNPWQPIGTLAAFLDD